jgi:hypothetical protein
MRLWEVRNPPRCALLLAQGQGSGYVQHPLIPSKWDRWKDDWVIMQADVHDRLELLARAPTSKCGGWEKVPNLQRDYDTMVKRIRFMVD